MFNRLKELFKPTSAKRAKDEPENHENIPIIAPTDNPWRVPLLDVRPVTLKYISTSKDKQCAANAISFGSEDGLAFSRDTLRGEREVSANLEYRIDQMLAPGALYLPREMENKWALFYHDRRIICVRSWTRKAVVVADVEINREKVIISRLRGRFCSDQEDSFFTVRTLDFLIRTHALGEAFPAPLPPDFDKAAWASALWCFSMFGRHAHFASAHRVEAPPPERPLRTHSMLHIAVARGDDAQVEALVKIGIPIDLIGADTLTPLHWALSRKDVRMSQLLLRFGAAIDVRSTEGVTPLMTACQRASIEHVQFLLTHGADPNATDERGFTALHRAAEGGRVDVVQLLLDNRANPSVEAHSQTPLSLAEKRSHKEVVEILRAAI